MAAKTLWLFTSEVNNIVLFILYLKISPKCKYYCEIVEILLFLMKFITYFKRQRF